MQNIIPQNFPADLKLKTIPFAHQQEATERSWNKEYFALLMEMGTGKSKVTIDTAAALFHTKQINGMLIIAPKGVYLNWIRDEIPRHMPDQIDYAVAPWKAQMDKKEDYVLQRLMTPSEGVLDILVMNIEGINVKRGMEAAVKFIENHECLTVIDESTCIKSFNADRSRKAWTLGKLSKFRRIMTGSPITQNPLDLFSQFQFLSMGCLKFKSFTAFRAYYAVMTPITFGTRAFAKITGYRNIEQLQRDIIPVSYRKLKSECLDLPPKIYQTHYFEMDGEQRRLYNKLRDEALIEFKESAVSTTSALTTIMKLQQIACGHVTDDQGVSIAISHSRVDTLINIVETIDGKIIIWAAFRHDVQRIIAALSEEHGKKSAVHYYGDTTNDEREEAITRFRNDPDCRFFVGTAATGGMGITLIEAATTIYYSNGYNLLHRIQSEDRNHRIGQKANSVTIIDIVCENTVDSRIVKILKAKKDLASLVLDNWEALLDDNEALQLLE
jgi:hypothetical protein